MLIVWSKLCAAGDRGPNRPVLHVAKSPGRPWRVQVSSIYITSVLLFRVGSDREFRSNAVMRLGKTISKTERTISILKHRYRQSTFL